MTSAPKASHNTIYWFPLFIPHENTVYHDSDYEESVFFCVVTYELAQIY